MIYNFKIDYQKFSDIFNEGLILAKTNKQEAQNFFKQYIQYILEDNDKVNTIEEAERIAKSNFGYYAGYFNQEVCDIIYKTYQCSHPIFGDKPFAVSPEEAYQKGLEIGREISNQYE